MARSRCWYCQHRESGTDGLCDDCKKELTYVEDMHVRVFGGRPWGVGDEDGYLDEQAPGPPVQLEMEGMK